MFANILSLSLDTRVKGKKKRTEVVVRYFCEDEGFEHVVEKILLIIKSSHETVSHLAESLFTRFESEKVDMSNLVSINTDSCSVMSGKKSLFSTQLHLLKEQSTLQGIFLVTGLII